MVAAVMDNTGETNPDNAVNAFVFAATISASCMDIPENLRSSVRIHQAFNVLASTKRIVT